jgi:lysophospholipase L1-like esterase
MSNREQYDTHPRIEDRFIDRVSNYNSIAVEMPPPDGPGISFKWSGVDTESLYLKNLDLMEPTWRYATKEVVYNRNALGYRTKELSAVTDNNFFMVFGCSFTEGEGLAEDEMWANMLSDRLGIPVINHAKGGGNSELVYLNSLLFLKNSASVRPKFVVIQWPDPARMMYKSLEKFGMLGPWDLHEGKPFLTEFYNIVVKHKADLYNSLMMYHSTMLLWKQAGIPVYNWTYDTVWENNLNITFDDIIWANISEGEMEPLNMARDTMHFGVKWNYRVAERLAKSIKTKILNRSAG